MGGRFGWVALLCAVTLVGTSSAVAAVPEDACGLLTTAQVSAALGETVGKGEYIHPGYKQSCTWTAAGGESVTLQLQTVRMFDAGKGGIGGGQRTSASGVGEEAYYLGEGGGIGLEVKKGGGSFKVTVYSKKLSIDQKKAAEMKLAQGAVAKF